MAARRRPWWAYLVLLLGGLVVGTVLAEGIARVIPAPGGAQLLMSAPENAPDRLYAIDHDLGNLPAPGFDGESRSPGYAVHLRVNQHGLRGAEPGPKAKPRWLAAGDSFTFAAQVAEDVAFVGQLGARGGREWLHGGADGWSTWQPALLHRRLDAQLELDGLLVVFFLGNDFVDNARFRMHVDNARRRPNGTALDMPPTAAWRRFLSRRSYLWGLTQMRGRESEFRGPQSRERERWAGELRPFTDAALPPGYLRETEAALQYLKTSVGTDELLVAIAPPPFAVDPARLSATWELLGLDPARAAPDHPRDLVVGLLTRLGIPACDLTDPLRASVARGEDPYFTYDGHWNAVGHALVAERIAECLGPR